MGKTLKIAWNTYTTNVLRGAFLFFAFGLPLLSALFTAVFVFFASQVSTPDVRPIGYVDLPQLLGDPAPWLRAHSHQVEMQPFASEAAARAALDEGQIQGYYRLAPDYLSSGEVVQVAQGQIDTLVQQQFRDFVRDSLFRTSPPEVRHRIVAGSVLFHRAIDDGNEHTAQLFLKTATIWGMLAGFYLVNSFTSSYILQSLADEHANRTIEIMFTSATVWQLLAGKIVGLVALGLTPVLVWGGALSLSLEGLLTLLNRSGLDLAIAPPWDVLLLGVLVLLPTYAMHVTMTALLGAVTGVTGQSQDLALILGGLPMMLWYPASYLASVSPNSPVVVFLSIFPLTSPACLLIRASQVRIPPWQISLSLLLLWGLCVGTIAVSARLYRAAWLIAGHRRWFRALLRQAWRGE